MAYRGFFGDKIRKIETEIGFLGIELVPHLFKQVFERGVIKLFFRVFPPFFKRFYKSAHVRAFEVSRQIHTHINFCNTVLFFVGKVADDKRNMEVFYSDFINGQRVFRLCALYIFQRSAVIFHNEP